MTYLAPGPLDPSVLHSQLTHRSQLVWDDEYTDPLTCVQREAVITRTLHNRQYDPRIDPYLHQAGFYGLASIGFMSLDWHLITALVERWRPETHTFHMPFGELTVTLQDVAILWGLPVDGLAVTGLLGLDWRQLCFDLLGVTLTDAATRGNRLKLTWLSTAFNSFTHLPPDADDIAIQRYARAYILSLIGGVLMPDKSCTLVHMMFLPLLADFETTGRYSWGAACLAWLYRELCKATRPDAMEIAGPLVLFQVWAWDRFPCIAPRRLSRVALEYRPLAFRWQDDLRTTDSSTHVLVEYRYMMEQLQPDQIEWEPYRDIMSSLPAYCLHGHGVWRTRSPLICFFIAEWHFPDRVMRQFGMIQPTPVACFTDPTLHGYDLRGRHADNWTVLLREQLAYWDARMDHIIDGQIVDAYTTVEHGYFLWYFAITRRFITRYGASLSQVTEAVQTLEDPILRANTMESLGYLRTNRVRHDHGHAPTPHRGRPRARRNDAPAPTQPEDHALDPADFDLLSDDMHPLSTPSGAGPSTFTHSLDAGPSSTLFTPTLSHSSGAGPFSTPFTPSYCMIPTPGSSFTSFQQHARYETNIPHIEADAPHIDEPDESQTGERPRTRGRGARGQYVPPRPARNRQRPPCGTGGHR